MPLHSRTRARQHAIERGGTFCSLPKSRASQPVAHQSISLKYPVSSLMRSYSNIPAAESADLTMGGLHLAYLSRCFLSQDGSRSHICAMISSRRRALPNPFPIYAIPAGHRMHSANPLDRFSQKKNDSRHTTRCMDASPNGMAFTVPGVVFTRSSSRYFCALAPTILQIGSALVQCKHGHI